MSTLNEVAYSALLDVTGASAPITLNELKSMRLQQLGFTGTLSEMWHQLFTEYSIPVGSWNERFYQFLYDRGCDQPTLNERQFCWYSGGGSTRFCVAYIFHPAGEDYIQVQFTEAPDTVDAVGWSVLVNSTPVTPVFVSLSDRVAKFNIGDTVIGNAVFVSYDGAGNTLLNGEQCCTFVDTKASNTLDGDYQFAAAGSMYMLTDGAANASYTDHELQYMALGHGSKTPITPDGLALPDFEGIYRQDKANDPSWFGSRVVTNHLLNSDVPVTQNIAAKSGETWVFSAKGVGDYDLSGLGIVESVVSAGADELWAVVVTPNADGNILVTVNAASTYFQMENISGQSNQNPSNYVRSNGVPTTLKFSNYNGNTGL
ncbi:MAG: hypothetical protein DRH90_25570 [Deltaproteobacteria bacterium]|nr:MAG: hypothetical protein DRH90_25570 [Deltaproteobacteria bacterium]